MNRKINYKGMECEVIEEYMAPGDGPYLKICSSKDIDKALTLGFTCMGYPDEVMKRVEEVEIVG